MTDFQLSILKQDADDLTQYITEVTNKGKLELANKLHKKLHFLNSRIAEFT